MLFGIANAAWKMTLLSKFYDVMESDRPPWQKSGVAMNPVLGTMLIDAENQVQAVLNIDKSAAQYAANGDKDPWVHAVIITTPILNIGPRTVSLFTEIGVDPWNYNKPLTGEEVGSASFLWRRIGVWWDMVHTRALVSVPRIASSNCQKQGESLSGGTSVSVPPTPFAR